MSAETPAAPISLRHFFAPGIRAVRAFWKPFVVIQLTALAMVLAYYHFPATQRACEGLANLKLKWGYVFAAIACAISAGVIPEIFKTLVMGLWRYDRRRWLDIRFNLLYFACLGVCNDALYRLNSLLFGDELSVRTVLSKVLFDMFVYTPFFSIPLGTLMYQWKSGDATLLTHVRAIGMQWYLTRVVALLVTCWAFWGPTVSLVYALPAPLQFSLFSLANAAWSILMVAVATRK